MEEYLESMAAFRSEFQPRNDDILLTSFPKTGTTWLMALCHNILNLEEDEEDILTEKNPHDVVPTLDGAYLADQLPYSCLPEAVRNSGCKLVHLARNPKDTLVSMWHFYNKILRREPMSSPFPIERAVESFCSGVIPWGPFYEHVVGYWEESRKRPDEVLFLKYEELCRDPKDQVRKLASFLKNGDNDDDDDVVEKVLQRSSLGRLKELEVNKNGVLEIVPIPNAHFFRKGTVGDWKSCLTPQMAKRIDHLTQFKLRGTGLSLDDF
ncbi:unnamed protein product [Linum tenue]|uniref:Sulfotransferase n=1 Tax=Linum tenue TaxID=586396 RepID=A0AAV0GYY6_9ROSI|nr:unnamed protein product [Linum tenue]